jgi:hypothetical protein
MRHLLWIYDGFKNGAGGPGDTELGIYLKL